MNSPFRSLAPFALPLLLCCLAVLALCGSGAAQVSPFTGAPAPKSAQAGSAVEREAAPGQSFLGSLTTRLAPVQQEMNRRLSALGRELRTAPGGQTFWLFMVLAAAYGVLHALGPGHGKTMVGAYFLARGGRGRMGGYAAGLLVSLAASAAHTLSAVLLVLLAAALVMPLSTSLDQAGALLLRLSGAALCLAGLVMAWRAARDLRRAQAGAAPQKAEAAPASLRGGLGVALAVGVVPCPVAALVFSFCLGLGLPWTGAAAMLAMALGMGLTTSAFAALAIACRGAVTGLCGVALPRAAATLALAGGLLLSLFGGLALLV